MAACGHLKAVLHGWAMTGVRWWRGCDGAGAASGGPGAEGQAGQGDGLNHGEAWSPPPPGAGRRGPSAVAGARGCLELEPGAEQPRPWQGARPGGSMNTSPGTSSPPSATTAGTCRAASPSGSGPSASPARARPSSPQVGAAGGQLPLRRCVVSVLRAGVSSGFTEIMPWQSVPLEESLPTLQKGDTLAVAEVKLLEKQTSPPDYLTEAELITLMEKHGIGGSRPGPPPRLGPTVVCRAGHGRAAGDPG